MSEIEEKEQNRSDVRNSIVKGVGNAQFVAFGHTKPGDDTELDARLDFEKGFWKKANDPPRYVVHIVPNKKDFEIRLPFPKSQLGVVSTDSGGPKVCLVYRIVPLVMTGPSSFRRPREWEWFLVLVPDRPIRQVGNSGRVFVDFSKRSIDIRGRESGDTTSAPVQSYNLSDMILVSLSSPDSVLSIPGFATGLSYSQVTSELSQLLSSAKQSGGS